MSGGRVVQTAEDRILDEWDRLKAAIGRVECALPVQMSEAMRSLIFRREAMEDLLCREVFRTATPPQEGTTHDR